jgi:DNA invertase Pin-like site-specific DNA recombinase
LELDTTLNLRDLGLSAFDGSNVEKGALGAFLQAIRERRIAKGSYLLVESLDRISRAQIMQALAIFTQIINAGIIIVTLADEMIYSSERLADDPMPLIMSIMVMIRAHEESATKSKRVKAAWAAKRLRLDAQKLTRTCPSWMELDDSRKSFRLIPANVRVVKRILKLHREGVGQSTIARTLNQKGVPPIQTRVPTEGWHMSTIQKIVTNPALYGAYQPTIGVGNKKRLAHGDPIEGY